MNIFLSHPTAFDYKAKLYTPFGASALAKVHTFHFPLAKGTETNTKETIKKSDLLIADLSVPSSGVGVEMGWANAYDIPIICVYERGSSISGALRLVTTDFIEYDDAHDLLQKLEVFLATLPARA